MLILWDLAPQHACNFALLHHVHLQQDELFIRIALTAHPPHCASCLQAEALLLPQLAPADFLQLLAAEPWLLEPGALQGSLQVRLETAACFYVVPSILLNSLSNN
jgi:hypothetical protein